ncbi:hypothetical protein [Bifidobacterium magnum]|uniref:Large tegument protein n=2 Tax=Bifidobacterium magnum TaxID=1692 RepID=A0A087BBI8_9BIFI|nr:hypothetical protein [Bifidobacterium magnum]KFI68388.1 hypothetical protein BMAGN_0349 [Bifidobacterium magnum]
MEPQPTPRNNRRIPTRSITVGKHTYDSALIVTVLGALLTIVGTFAPFVQTSMTYGAGPAGLNWSGFNVTQTVTKSVNLQDVYSGVGWIVCIAAVIVGILAVVRQDMAALIVTIIDDVVVIYSLARAAVEISGAGGSTNMYSITYGFGAGAWMLVIGAIVMLIGVIIAYYNDVNAKKNGNQAPMNNPQYPAMAMPASGAAQYMPPQQAGGAPMPQQGAAAPAPQQGRPVPQAAPQAAPAVPQAAPTQQPMPQPAQQPHQAPQQPQTPGAESHQ